MSIELQTLKNELKAYKNKLELEVSAFTINNTDFLNADNWYTSSDETKIFNQLGYLCISSQTTAPRYLSYNEKNCSFSVLPKQIIYCLGNYIYEVEVTGELVGNVNLEIFIIEYSKTAKLKVSKMPINKKVIINTHKETENIRFAIKIKGFGMCSIERINFSLTRDSKNEKNEFSEDSVIHKKIDSLKNLKLACIFDEFTTTCYENTVTLIPIGINDWKEKLIINNPDLLMVESAWRGTNGQWDQKIAKYNTNNYSEIKELIEWCNAHAIPTVFWNKEDPIHYEKFIDVARLFDYIFTTDSNKIPDYVNDLNNEKIYALPFSAEPSLHNPIKIVKERENSICFAGSYYGNRHEDRKKDMDQVLKICADYGLVIYDRNFEKNKNPKSLFQFPSEFRKYTRPSLKYSEIDKAYKGHEIMLNVNSVKYSPTMFSRRVFEGLASGTPIISTYSQGIKNIFGNLVLMAENNDDLPKIINRIKKNTTTYDEISLKGIREVYNKHTYEHRLETILNIIGIEYMPNIKTIKVIAVAKSYEEFECVLTNFKNQVYPDKTLTVYIENFDGYVDLMNRYNTNTIQVQLKSYLKNYENISKSLQEEYSFIANFSPNNFYGKNYLLDLMIGTVYSKAEIVGKRSYFEVENNQVILQEPNRDYIYTNNLDIYSCIIRKDIFAKFKVNYYLNNCIQDIDLGMYFKQGVRLFSIDKYNFVKNKYRETNPKILSNIEL